MIGSSFSFDTLSPYRVTRVPYRFEVWSMCDVITWFQDKLDFSEQSVSYIFRPELVAVSDFGMVLLTEGDSRHVLSLALVKYSGGEGSNLKPEILEVFFDLEYLGSVSQLLLEICYFFQQEVHLDQVKLHPVDESLFLLAFLLKKKFPEFLGDLLDLRDDNFMNWPEGFGSGLNYLTDLLPESLEL